MYTTFLWQQVLDQYHYVSRSSNALSTKGKVNYHVCLQQSVSKLSTSSDVHDQAFVVVCVCNT